MNYPNSDADGSFLYANGLANSFNDATLLFKQTYSIQKIVGGATTTIVKDAPSRVGDVRLPNYAPPAAGDGSYGRRFRLVQLPVWRWDDKLAGLLRT